MFTEDCHYRLQDIALRAWSTTSAGRYRPSNWRRRLRINKHHSVGRVLAVTLSIVLPFLLLPLVVTAGYVGATRYFPHVFADTATSADAPKPAGDATSESERKREAHRIGAIVFVPWTGVDKCEKREFDNANGRIKFDGTVKCEFEPPTEIKSDQLRLSDEKPVSAAERMRAIHNSFKK